MKTLIKTSYPLLLICFALIVGCANKEGKKQDVTSGNLDGPHLYDITINPGADNERHIKGEIENVSKDDGTINNFSVSSTIDSGEAMVLRIGNEAILITGLFYYAKNGKTSDLFDGSEDESEEKSSLMISIAPPSMDINSSLSGTVKLSNVKHALKQKEGSLVGYTLNFDGQFEDVEDNTSRMVGKIEVSIPNYRP